MRPILWVVGDEPEAVPLAEREISTLHSAVTVGSTQSRHQAIKAILEQICTDFEHSGWSYLRHLWRQCAHLPLASFDVWSIAVMDTKLLAALVLQMDESFTRKYSEELPVFWELIPLNDWLAVFTHYKNYLENVMDDADVNEMLEMRIEKVGAVSQSLDIVTRILKQWLCNKANQHPSFSQVSLLISQYQQELDRRQANSHWPEVLKLEIVSHWKKMGKLQQQWLKLENISDHHRAVVILPVLLAAYCANTNTPENWIGNAAVIFKLKRLKAFDEDWFNEVFNISLAYLSQQPKD